ncbi:hypothetical protein MKZ38_002089 [Zalerion maritima]|uniref:Ergosterol biosynthetic protein 28 n=1 Tax=Zalerion maritima TaxID=339359 RepID=A0AAD5RZG7_9PEZI|nr:hypothetical protein MKZ38_002089 [Zalerion maritima]
MLAFALIIAFSQVKAAENFNCTMEAFLPETKGGFLPWYILGLSVISIGNSIQNYATLHYTRRLYNGLFVPNKSLLERPKSEKFNPEDSVNKLIPVPSANRVDGQDKRSDPPAAAADGPGPPQDQATPLACRLFGTYTLVISVVRLYVAYNISSAPMYQLGIMTYVVAWVHFVSELAVFRTQTLGKPQLFPLVFATGGIAWMAAQYGYYVD